MSSTKNAIFSEQELNLCEYGGAIGVLLSLTCLIQHLVVTVNNWITQSLVPGYLFAMVALLLLALKKTVAPVFLIISTILSMIIVFVWTKHQAFSAVVIALLLYHIVLVVGLYVEQVPAKLKENKQAQKAEEDAWAGKI
ncbi:MAG: hypothetical protein SGI83_12725 [Bacteroidota bacterium]|nr:hypothetical protein [Bacteroidota bacterium]